MKVDTIREDLWRKLNRPHPSLRLPDLLEGIHAFTEMFRGELVTETMLVRGINDSGDHLEEDGRFLARLKPARAYLSAPIRPPAEQLVEPPSEDSLNRGFQVYNECGVPVELLVDYEGDAFSSTGNVGEELLAITAVHPMREDAVREFFVRKNLDWRAVQGLIERGRLVETEYKGKRFYMTRFRDKRR